jgi:DNA-binding NarL/FixJ family response regulator
VIAAGADALAHHGEHVARATAAVVDVALDPPAATELCRGLHAHRPGLPVLALVCCPHSVTPWDLRELLDAGIAGLLDLRARADDARRALESAARGETVLHLQLARGGKMLLQDALGGGTPRGAAQLALLELVARGLPDREIGTILHLSPHTVKHQIDQLRRELGVRNRTELAAWAGRHGFYAPPSAQAGTG